MKLDTAGLEFLREQEGFEVQAYKDVAGYLTIGVGHLITPNERRTGIIRINERSIPWGVGLTDQQVLDLLAQDVVKFENAVNEVVSVPITQNQFNALVSLAFNIGVTAFKTSTLVAKLNAGEYEEAKEQFHVWRKAGGKIVQGLVNRRAREAGLFGADMEEKEREKMVTVPAALLYELIDATNALDDVMDRLGNFLTK